MAQDAHDGRIVRQTLGQEGNLHAPFVFQCIIAAVVPPPLLLPSIRSVGWPRIHCLPFPFTFAGPSWLRLPLMSQARDELLPLTLPLPPSPSPPLACASGAQVECGCGSASRLLAHSLSRSLSLTLCGESEMERGTAALFLRSA